MKARLVLAAACSLALAVLVSTGASALVSVKLGSDRERGGKGGDNGIHDTRKVETFNCNSDGSHQLIYNGPKDIWPPNHKYRNVSIVADGHDDDNVAIAVVPTHDEYVNGEELNGSGNTDNDAIDTTPAGADTGTGTAQWTGQVRGERSGRGDGRTYSFDVTATFDDAPQPCTHTFTATVPHDQRNHTNSGPKDEGGKGGGKGGGGRKASARRSRARR